MTETQPDGSLELGSTMLGKLSSGITVPAYDRRRVHPSIIHFGVGAFHRAHQAVYADEILASGDLRWGIRGAGITAADAAMRADLAAQDFLYTVTARDLEREEVRVVGSILDLIVPESDPSALVAALASEETRIISFTITENGYCYRADTGALDFDNPSIRNDLRAEASFRTIYGCLRGAFELIRRRHSPPPTLLSCDNLPHNGDRLRRLLLEFLGEVDSRLRDYVAAEVSFPNCMVDRITPATTGEQRGAFARQHGFFDRRPVFCEGFRQWVIEDKFTSGRPDWSRAGATFVSDVAPFERMKIRLLNGSHSALGYTGYLLGYRSVDHAMADPIVRTFINRYMDEIAPTVGRVPGIDLERYEQSLLERFANPAIADQLLRLAQDGSKKVPNMILQPVEELLGAGSPCPAAAFALAVWIRFLEGTDETGAPIPIDDPKGEELHGAALATRSAGVERFFGVESIFPSQLVHNLELMQTVAMWLAELRACGTRAALEAWAGRTPRREVSP